MNLLSNPFIFGPFTPYPFDLFLSFLSQFQRVSDGHSPEPPSSLPSPFTSFVGLFLALFSHFYPYPPLTTLPLILTFPSLSSQIQRVSDGHWRHKLASMTSFAPFTSFPLFTYPQPLTLRSPPLSKIFYYEEKPFKKSSKRYSWSNITLTP